MGKDRRPLRFRRTTYLVVAGLGTLGTLAGLLHSPAGGRWILRQVDTVLRDRTGLGVRAREARFFLNGGRLLAEGLQVGDGLLSAERLEVSVDYLSLVRGRPRLKWVRLERPVVRLEKALLDAIQVKPSAPGPARWFLDSLVIRDGRLLAGDPAWGPARAEATFAFEGTGPGAGRLEGTLRMPSWTVHLPHDRVEGTGLLQVQVSDPRMEVRGTLASARDQVTFAAAYLAARRTVEGQVHLEADLTRILHVASQLGSEDGSGSLLRDLEQSRGRVVVDAGVTGAAHAPRWRLALQGKELVVPTAGLTGMDVTLQASGGREHLTLEHLVAQGPDGALEAHGEWHPGRGTRFALDMKGARLDTLSTWTRIPSFKGTKADLKAELAHSGEPWRWPALSKVRAVAAGTLVRADGGEGGHFNLETVGDQIRVRDLRLDLPLLAFEGQGQLEFAGKRLLRVEGTATAGTEAAAVSDALYAWDLIHTTDPEGRRVPWRLDMAGTTKAQASVSWDGVRGLLLTGWVDIAKPRWVGATADTLRTDVSIIGGDLRLSNLEVAKGEGRGLGTLWLTWADVLPGQKQFDLCMGVSRLPLAEGLKAADLDPEDYPLEGRVSGSVQLAGAYAGLHLWASVQGEEVHAYDLRLPAVAFDLDYPIAEDRLKATDLRITETLQGLGQETPDLGVSLDLRGALELDLKRETWLGGLRGRLDSQPLAIPGPRFQAEVEARFDGPLAVHMGPTLLPSGHLAFRRGRLFFGNQSLDGVGGSVEVEGGTLAARLGLEGRPEPLVRVLGWREGQSFVGAAKVDIGPSSADTATLGGRLTSDVLRDLRLEGDVRGTWTAEGLHWRGQLTHLEGAFSGFNAGQVRPSPVEGTERSASFRLALAGSGEDSAPGAALDIQGVLPFAADRPMSVHFSGGADLARVKAVLDAVVQPGQGSLLAELQPAGRASLALTLGGTPRVPRLDGRLDLQEGQLRIRTYPQSAENVSFSLDFQDRSILLPESRPLRGRLALGTLSAFGRAAWDLTGLRDYDLKARLQDFQFRDVPEGFELQGSAEATLTGNDRGGRLKGTLDARNLLYRADVKLTDVLMASAMGGSLSGPLFDPEDPLRLIDLDLDLRLAEPWQFDTNLLKLQGRPTGPFKVLGTLAQPGLKGTMEFLPGGRITNLLPAGDVVLERGSIDFKDPRSFNPVLNLLGRVDVSPFVVNLGIQGSLDQLTFSPTSTPSLRQDEIMAILVDPGLASTVGSIGTSAAGTLAHYGLARTGGGILSTLAIAGFQEQLRQTFNLDRVSFTLRPGTGSPEMAFTVGKSVDLLGRRTPVVVTHRRAGDLVTLSGQLEWRFGDFVLQLGASRTGTTGVNPSGEVRWTWSPR